METSMRNKIKIKITNKTKKTLSHPLSTTNPEVSFENKKWKIFFTKTQREENNKTNITP